jgi:DNA polymerase V
MGIFGSSEMGGKMGGLAAYPPEQYKPLMSGLRRIYQHRYKLSKAGVLLLDLAPDVVHQGELDLSVPGDLDAATGLRGGKVGRDRALLMAALDGLNVRYGRGTIHVASTGAESQPKTRTMRQERRTPQYTTRRDEVPVARA